MAFKNPFRADKLAKIPAKKCMATLKVLLDKKLKPGMTVPFMILFNHKYSDLDEDKSKKLPAFLIGARDSSWKDYHKKKLDGGKSQKEFTVTGSCTRNGDELVLNLDGGKGLRKIPAPNMTILLKMLKKINKDISISTKGGDQKGEEDNNTEKETQPVGPSDNKKSKPKSEKAVAFIKEKQEEALEMKKLITELSSLMQTSLKKVAVNVNKGMTSKKDIEIVKHTNKVYMEVMVINKTTHKEIQKQFSPQIKSLKKQKKDLYKLSKLVKVMKKGVADRVCKAYCEARKIEINQDLVLKIQKIVRDSLMLNKKHKSKVSQDVLLKGLTYILKNKVNVNRFDVKYVDELLTAKARKAA